MLTPVDKVLAEHGVHTGPLRSAMTRLRAGWQEFDQLVRESTAPRRSLQELLDALGDDLERDGDALRIQPARAQTYAHLDVPGTPDDLGPDAEHLSVLAGLIENVPPPLAALDHVQATAETVLRRALWLDTRYDLRRARLVLLGDHDLTSLAIRLVRPEAEVTVVDLDDRVLEYLDRHSDRSVTTIHADLRIGLPPAVTGSADLVFSDPPYTPEGMALFAARGVECLADPPKGRLLLAYGYSPRHPALGAQVQRELAGIGLVFESIVPDFHRYHGAQAIGSAADLYVCQPTGHARKSGGAKGQPGIYTHGPQSVESTATAADLLAALAAVAGEGGQRVEQRRADWAKPVSAQAGTAITMDLTADPGPWLLRALLATNAERVAVLLPNAHPDLANADAQRALSRLVGPKYRLRLLRSTPDNTHAVVVADAAPPQDGTATVRHAVWTRAHGKLGNTGREALIAASGGTMTKNEARDRMSAIAPDLLDLRLIDLPRHRIAQLAAALSS
ncbi:Predicted methyltransferase [Amycolatopsis marina]|uniref:Predicted methyltransferase n=1 Tax=Amycolatopsis marina TaxID=490629 RepID=A0A1I1CLR6_9PSEU|nr:bis-aminopropyl spermidine synthase family protein [Amycolatopsis marina]SFB61868.1 Predicted methyltransferase [Amycolatopsis marina]